MNEVEFFFFFFLTNLFTLSKRNVQQLADVQQFWFDTFTVTAVFPARQMPHHHREQLHSDRSGKDLYNLKENINLNQI